MKKMLALLFAASMVLSLCACGEKPETAVTTVPDETVTAQVEAAADTLGQALLADFKGKMATGENETAEEMASELATNEAIPYMTMSMPVEEGYLAGFTEEIHGFKEAAVFNPAIGSIPFVGYIFTLDDGADVNAFVQNLKDKSDLRWNICTEADELVCDNVGNTVFFVMCNANPDAE